MRIAAAGDGYAALLSEEVDESGARPDRLLIQVGRHGSFGPPTELSPALPLGGSPFGLAAGGDGAVTVGWQGCTPGPTLDGAVTLHDCQVYGETGTMRHGFGMTPSLLAPHSPGTRLSGLVAGGAVAVQSCRAPRRCGLAVALARPDGGFARQPITADSHRLLALQGDGRGDLVLVWSDSRGVLRAATRAAAEHRSSAPHRLAVPARAA